MAKEKDEKEPIVIFTLDFETGGLDSQKHACTQIAIHATRLDTFERLGSYVQYIAPYKRKEIKKIVAKKKVLKSKYDVEDQPMMEYTEDGFKYSGLTMDVVEEKGVDFQTVAEEVVDFIKEYATKPSNGELPFLVGQNIEFDKGFFMQMMEYAGLTKEVSKVLKGHVDFYGNWQPTCIDTLLLGQIALCANPNVNSYNLEIMCESLGVELVDAHDANADVTATTNVVATLAKRMRENDGTGSGISLGKTEKTRKHFKI